VLLDAAAGLNLYKTQGPSNTVILYKKRARETGQRDFWHKRFSLYIEKPLSKQSARHLLIKCTPRQRRRPVASGLCSVRNARQHNHIAVIAQYTDEAALYTVRQAGINLNYITHTQGIIIRNKEIIKKGKKIGLISLSI
jgi:hypothetical protein